MPGHVAAAHFIHDSACGRLLDRIRANPHGSFIRPVPMEAWLAEPAASLLGAEHVVIAASMGRCKQLLLQAAEGGFSVGIIPIDGHGKMARFLGLPEATGDAIEFALRDDGAPIDLILCNGKVMLFRATLGWLPMVDEPPELGRLLALLRALRRLGRIRLVPITVVTAQGRTIRTAACGGAVFQRHLGSLGSRVTETFKSVSDSGVGLLLASPKSVLDYLETLFQLAIPRLRRKKLPKSLGVIKSTSLRIETQGAMVVQIDGVPATSTPLVCENLPKAVRVNVDGTLRLQSRQWDRTKDLVQIADIPDERELAKSLSPRLPFFSYASEDRFRDLFISLRQDATMSANYVALMILSTMLATVGLYLDNAAVIIGAMLLAPLMAPLVSASMGILRGDQRLIANALRTILFGVTIAIAAAALTTLTFQHRVVTQEMLARLHPTLLDLAVAIFSGIAAAYSKACREAAQNLAGVAIAVALVPPLAVAGIGLGRGDGYFFLQAFLLFMTNLVGIVLAAMFTFRVMGYSAVVVSKRGLGIMLLLLALISVPLYLSYHHIIERRAFEASLERDRFLVNGKYLRVGTVEMGTLREGRLELNLDVFAREPLTRADLTQIKEKLQVQFDEELVVHANVIYSL